MLNNISFLALFVFLTPCFASDPTKIHIAFSHLVRPFGIYAQCGLNLFLFRQNNDVCWRNEKISFSFRLQINQCYRLSAGRLLMASSFNLSTARVYFSVCFKPLWPRRLATILILAPLLRMLTAKEWRLMCQLTFSFRLKRYKKF